MYCDLKEGAREAVCIAVQTGRAVGARRWALGRGAQGVRGVWGACEARGGRAERAGRGQQHDCLACDTALGRLQHGHVRALGCACARLGVLLGKQVVHLVHSACF